MANIFIPDKYSRTSKRSDMNAFGENSIQCRYLGIEQQNNKAIKGSYNRVSSKHGRIEIGESAERQKTER